MMTVRNEVMSIQQIWVEVQTLSLDKIRFFQTFRGHDWITCLLGKLESIFTCPMEKSLVQGKRTNCISSLDQKTSTFILFSFKFPLCVASPFFPLGFGGSPSSSGGNTPSAPNNTPKSDTRVTQTVFDTLQLSTPFQVNRE